MKTVTFKVYVKMGDKLVEGFKWGGVNLTDCKSHAKIYDKSKIESYLEIKGYSGYELIQA